MSVEEQIFIGNGRSAKVYLSLKVDNQVATKIFTGESTSKVILYILTGSANPYTWCEDAIKSAMIRRRLLSKLSLFWFSDKVRLPETYEYSWNDKEKAFQIEAEYIKGCHSPLLNPMEEDPVDYISELQQEIMAPLQQHLMISGFDGLVWQAGKGNPVAVSNFMVEFDEDGNHKWVWIDLESGLPALFALNPISTLTYYLPKCIKHQEWLFDRVDTKKLYQYLSANKQELVNDLGNDTFDSLQSDCRELEEAQDAWKGIKRFRKSLYYAASQGKISAKEKEHYDNKPIRWYLKSLIMLMVSFFGRIPEKLKSFWTLICKLNFSKALRRSWRYFTNGRYRWGFARWYVRGQINSWQSRRSLTEAESAFLKNELHNDDSSSNLTDFSIHIAIKPLVKVFAWGVVPILASVGALPIEAAAIIVVGSGSIVRTSYTLWRFGHSLVKLKPQYPFIALFVGVFPVIGNLAFPLELVYRSSKKHNNLAKFIIYGLSANIGCKIPIWGGRDSGIEHFMVKIANRVIG